jgi:hypothetical protein
MSTIANVVILICVATTLAASIEIYTIVRARSIALLICAWGYMVVWRLVILVDQLIGNDVGWFQSNSAWFLIVFYLLVTGGMLTLMYSIRNPLNRKWEDHGKDKL